MAAKGPNPAMNTMVMDQAQAAPVTVSANAAQRIAAIIRQDSNPGLKLRIAVSGGGCSGFQYGYTLESQQNDEDLVVERDGVAVLIDPVSLEYLRGAEIDFVEDLVGASFQIKNPNATSSCGCGTSFAV